MRLAIVVLLAACAKDLSELEPYPCAATVPECPEGRACIDGGCREATLDQACSDFVDCSLADPNGRCLGGACTFDQSTFDWVCRPGVCAVACASDRQCPDKHLCDPATNTCLRECFSGCEEGFSCRVLGNSAACFLAE